VYFFGYQKTNCSSSCPQQSSYMEGFLIYRGKHLAREIMAECSKPEYLFLVMSGLVGLRMT